MKNLRKLILTMAAAALGFGASAQDHNAPKISVDNTTSCSGSPIEFTVECNSKIIYAHVDFGDGRDSYASINDEGSNSLTHSYTKAGTYTVSVYVMYANNDNSYSKSDPVTQEITIGENPVVTIKDDKTAYMLTAECDADASYKWLQGSTEMQSTESTLYYLESGTYTAIATNESGCSDTASIKVTYGSSDDSEPDVISINVVNNVITPGNRDGINDVLFIEDVADYENPCEVSVFDRRGKLVYSNKNYTNTNGFQGIDDNGNDLYSGTYYYVAKSKGRKGATGFVDIIR